MKFLAAIGRVFLGFLASTGRLGMFAAISVSHCVRPPFYPRLIWRQVVDIGYYSLPVVGLTAVFTGMVLALQSYTGFARFNGGGDRQRGGAVDHPRAGAGARRAEGPIQMEVRELSGAL